MSDVLPKLSLAQTLQRITEILAIAEDGGNTTQAVDAALVFAHNQLADSIDRRIGFIQVLNGGRLSVTKERRWVTSDSGTEAEIEEWPAGLIGAALKQAEEWRRKADTLKNILERIKEHTKALLEENPDIPFQGSQGRFELQRSAPSLQTEFKTSEKRYGNVLDPDDIARYDIGAQYLVMTQLTTLNTTYLREYLQSGKELPWAKLVESKHLRVRK